jgi:hypothetical protein
MARSMPLRAYLPKPRATLTDTFVRPGLEGAPTPPQLLPQPLGPDTQMASALGELTKSLSIWGVKLYGAEKSDIAAQEQIAIDRMDIDETRKVLEDEARKAEKTGQIPFGTNPFRTRVRQQFAAERIMQDAYTKILSDNLHLYSNPDTQEDPARFAQTAFQNLEIPGFFSQQRAGEMYRQMSSNWIGQVQRQKADRTVARNDEDFTDGYREIYGSYINEEYGDRGSPETLEQLMQNLQSQNDRVYSIDGTRGHEQQVSGLEDLTRQMTSNPDITREELEALDAVLVRSTMPTKAAEKGDPTGFGLGAKYGPELEEMRGVVDTKLRHLENYNYTEDTGNVKKIIDQILVEVLQGESDLPLDGSLTGELATHIQEVATEQGISRAATAAALLDLPDRVQGVASDTVQSSTGGMENASSTMMQLQQANITTAMAKSLIAQLVSNGDLSSTDGYKYLTGIDRLETSKAQRIALLERAAPAVFDALQTTSNTFDKRMDGEGVPVGLRASILEQASRGTREVMMDASDLPYPTDEARIDAMRQSGSSSVRSFGQIQMLDPETGGFRLNVETMEEMGFPADVVEQARSWNQMKNAEQLDFEVREVQARENTAMQLDDGYWWDSEMFSLVDNISDLSPSMASEANRLAVSELGVRAAADAATRRDEVASGEQFGRENIYRETFITPEGVFSRPLARFVVDKSRPPVETLAPQQTAWYVQGIRLEGLSESDLSTGIDRHGYDLKKGHGSSILSDPSMTIMVDKPSFIEDVNTLILLNNTGMSPESLIEHENLNDTQLITRYNLYTQFVGVEKSVSLSNFIVGQLQALNYGGIGFDPELIKALQASGEKQP